MALETHILAIALTNYFRNSTNTWRDSLLNYKSRLEGGTLTVEKVAEYMKGDAAHHERLLNKVTAVAASNLTKFDEALSVIGETRLGANTVKNNLIALAQRIQGATMTTQAEVLAEINNALTVIPDFVRLES